MAGRDPRILQLAVLGTLLAYGAGALAFEVTPGRIAVSAGVALAVQAAVDRRRGRRFDPRSALISGLSLALLLRTDGLGLAALAAAVAIASKAVLRWGGRHVFNPSCFAIVALLAATDRAWVSAGQWGSGPVLAAGLACLGVAVLARVPTRDVTAAFLATYAALVLGRAAWLGDPVAIPLRDLRTGALVVFAFFMISDPKTVPGSRPGRLVFAAAVAAGAFWIQYGLFRPNGLLWALAAAAPLVPVLDRLWPAARAAAGPGPTTRKEHTMTRPVVPAAFALAALAWAPPAGAFCGFYVAKADTKLFNRASEVVLVRDGDRTVLTMSNDYRGDLREFATVIPVPTRIERDQIHIGDRAILEHLDAYTAPRLVEYHDPNPCDRLRYRAFAMEQGAPAAAADAAGARAHGVTIEARYTVGEYDILILSAKESGGLTRWLAENGYRLPAGAADILGSYIKQGMRFFVAKVNLAEQAKTGFAYLRPLQVAYESPKFMLPIRLGTLNADGPQELFIFALTRTGRVETTNYRTTRLPSDVDVPLFVKDEFAEFYRAMFAEQVRRERMQTVFLEYAWDMGWCDPCAADPLSRAELEQLGVFWLGEGAAPGAPAPLPRIMPGPRPANVFVTRLHVRYDAAHFPADLVLQETGDRTNFQGRYILRHPYTGEMTCEEATAYRAQVAARQERDAQTLAGLTGWSLAEIRRKASLPGAAPGPDAPWWRRLWGRGG